MIAFVLFFNALPLGEISTTEGVFTDTPSGNKKWFFFIELSALTFTKKKTEWIRLFLFLNAKAQGEVLEKFPGSVNWHPLLK